MQEYLTYESFGAVGDGVHDDMPAIVKTHQMANALTLPVKAKAGACYYISPKKAVAEICTDTDWTGARFIIDDRGCEDRRAPAFHVITLEKNVPLSISSLSRGQTTVPNPHGCELFVTALNENHRDYIRFGLNQNNGTARKDNFLIGADGTLPSPIAFDFEEVTSVEARPVETTTLRLTGGEFTTIANPQDCTFTPYTATARNIRISRSQVEISGLTHYVKGEATHGTAYSGFLYITGCAHVTVQDCLFTGHYTYWCTGSAGKPVAMGSYDILCDNAVDIRFLRCRQTTDIEDKRYWGLFSSNFCRDLLLEDCMFSRFDTHMGVTNCTLRDCTFGHQSIKIIGNGNFLIESTRVVANCFIELRGDYGSSFRGDIEIRNCSWHPSGDSRSLISASNNGQHDFGYPCYLFENITINRFMVEAFHNPQPLALFSDYLRGGTASSEPPKYLPIPPKTVSISEMGAVDPIALCVNSSLMPDTCFILS